jgi:hypothetical protein
MEALVDRLDVDVRFLHSHLDFIPNAQRDWYTGSNLPSRNRQDFRLLNPSIVFLGMEGKILSVNLPSRYRQTMDWTAVRNDPLLMLQELFYFQTAAACQYLDMLRKLISG